MPNIQRDAIVPYTASQMYQLVDAIETYHEFIPWLQKAEILSRDEDEVRATLHFEGGGLRKSFTTCNRLQKDKMIEIRLVHGPFKHLEGFWRFDTLSKEQSHVKLDLEFEFSSRFLGMAFGPVFNQVANTLVEAFCDRAKEVYGVS